MKKLISILLSVIICFSIAAGFDLSVFADDLISGKCGDNVEWFFNSSTGELRISGSGDMWNYRCGDIAYPRDEYGEEYGFDQVHPEWIDKNCNYTALVIENGVTGIGTAAFKYGNISNVTIPASVEKIGYQAFYMVNRLFKAYFKGNTCSIADRAFIDTAATTVESEKFNGTFYCSKYSDIYTFALDHNIDYCIPESECSHIAYYNEGRGCFYCKLCNSFLFLEYDGSYVCKEHDLKEIEKKSPDCVSDGYVKSVCLVCGETIINTLPAKGHTGITDNAVEATCTQTGLTEGSHCSECGEIITEQKTVSALGHSFTNYSSDGNATCTNDGTKTSKCDRCEFTNTVIDSGTALGHNYVISNITPTCTSEGENTYTCSICGDTYTQVIPKLQHTYKTTTTKATTSKNGNIVTKCTICGAVKSKSTVYYPKTISLSAATYTYDGKVKKPTVKAAGSNGKTISSSNYTVTYAGGRKNVGKYAVKITFKGNYSGTKTLYFTIKPKATSLSSVSAKSKGFTVKWKKQATQTTGYQIQYSTSSKFTSPKTVMVSKNSTTSKTVRKLKSKKKYYVRIRTYKTVNGTKYYSSWSKSKSITTKK